MKNHHLALFLFCILLLAASVLFSACGDDGKTPGEQDLKFEAVEDWQSFTIIRGDQASSDTVSAAVELRSYLRDTVGVNIELATDWVNINRGEEVPVGTKEILVGSTNRPESEVEDVLLNDFVVAKKGDRIVITGGSGEAVQNAVAWFIENCINKDAMTVSVPTEPYVCHAEYEMGNVTIDGIPLWEYAICPDSSLTDLNASQEMAKWIAQQTGHTPEINAKDSEHKILFRYTDDLDLLVGHMTSGNGQITVALNAQGGSVAAGMEDFIRLLMERTTDDMKALDVKLGEGDAYQRASEKDIAGWREMTDKRIEAIRNAPSMPLPDGKIVFYVSNSGNDANDGRSPETAWATLGKVNTDALVGSVVLFERGSTFRGQLKTSANVTYSAYGEGPKPMIYGSPENGADPAKWTQAPDDPTIWIYSTPFSEDVGTMVFNEGEAHAVKYVLKAGAEGTSVTDSNHVGRCINMTWGNEFSDYHDLLYDLDFWHDDQDRKIYMRSSSNPGERFDSIEFNVHHNVISIGGAGNTIDNLCIKYGGCHGIGAGTTSDLTVQNCEFGWIGGSIQYVRDNRTVRYGNAVEIYGGCNRYSVTDCYIWQVYDAGITQQYTLSDSDAASGKIVNQKDVTYARNVIEYCNYCIEYFLGGVSDDNPSHIENFLIEDNYMWYAGTGFCEQRPDLTQGSIIKGWNHDNRAENYVIRDNLMVTSKDIMMHVVSDRLNPDGSESVAQLYNNTIANFDGGMYGSTTQGYGSWMPYDLGMISYLGEKTHGDTFWFISPDIDVEIGLAPRSTASSTRPRALDEWVIH